MKFIGKTLEIKADRKKILVIGDLHLGYEEAMNESGVFMTRQMIEDIKKELGTIFEKIGRVDYIILLGDVKHGFSGILKQEWNEILELWDYLKEFSSEVIVVKGNHDNFLMNIASKRDFVRVLDYFILGEYCFLHGDRSFDDEDNKNKVYSKNIKTWIMGHAHPAVTIEDELGVKSEKYKCFLVGKYKGRKIVIVPSFFGYIEGTDVRESDSKLAWDFDFDSFEVYVVSENLEVLDFGRLGKLGN